MSDELSEKLRPSHLKLSLDSFFHAIAFLTRFPVPRQLEKEAWAKSPPWYPVVGLVIGVLLAALARVLSLWVPPILLAVLVVSVWVYITGGLHLDGLMDTADGFGSQRDKERILEIMKDSRVGSMGVLAALLVLGNKVAALAVLHGPSQIIGLVLAPVFGRGAMLVALWFFPYARESGLAQSLRAVGKVGKVLSFGLIVILVLVSMWWLEWKVLFLLLLPLVVAWRLVATAQRKIGGCTGDIYGALCEGVEAAVLLALAFLQNV